MKKYLLASAIAVTLTWSPPLRANTIESTPIAGPATQHTIGVASWYGEQFHGRVTANGEIYDMNGLTAAHRDLPLGSWVEVTNVRNGRSVTLRINDRGPWIPGRMIDVSKATARFLGFVGAGITTVRLRIVDPPASFKSRRSRPTRPVEISSAALTASPRKEPFVRP